MYYYYFFYILYRWYESFEFKWWSEWKAALSVSILEIIIVATSVGFLSILFETPSCSNSTIELIIYFVILVSNYFILLHNDRWMPFVEKFDQLPKSKRRIGGVLVWIIILTIIAALIFMYYLLSQVNWD